MDEHTRPQQGDALLIVDMQRDFMPDGALPVPKSDALIPTINRWIRHFSERAWPVLASRDWHPADHHSFHANGGAWPRHCVQGTEGAEFAQGLQLPEHAQVIDKGVRRDSDGYSAFEDTGLAARLRSLGVRRLWVCGVATDYCVQASVLDALREGLQVMLIRDAVQAVDVHPGDGERARQRMREAGAVEVSSEGVLDAQ